MIEDIKNLADILKFLDYLTENSVKFTIRQDRSDSLMVTFTVIFFRVEVDFFVDHIEYSYFTTVKVFYCNVVCSRVGINADTCVCDRLVYTGRCNCAIYSVKNCIGNHRRIGIEINVAGVPDLGGWCKARIEFYRKTNCAMAGNFVV